MILTRTTRISMLAAAPLALGVGGCDPECTLSSPCGAFADLDLGRFTLVTSLEDLDFSEIQTGQAFDHWEFRRPAGGGGPEALASGGTLAATELSPDQRATLDAALPLGCFGPACFYHFVALDAAEARIWQLGISDLSTFLGPIDAPAEAVLAAAWRGYDFEGQDKRLSGVAADGADFLVLARDTRFCDPFEVRRALLHVSAAGDITERASEVLERDPEKCIVF